MKKIASITLIVSILITTLFTLTSCLHECSFEDEWSSDGDTHWNACEYDGCAKKSNSANHSWDKGVTTAKPTEYADGVKTHTCKICEITKEEPVKFSGLSLIEWEKALDNDRFRNCTYTETSTIYSDEKITTETIYKFTDSRAYAEITVNEETQSTTVGANEAMALRNSLASSLREVLSYHEFEYDYDDNVYRLNGHMYIAALNTVADSATLTFKNGKLVKFKYKCTIESNGKTVECMSTVVISNYGTTKID